MIFVRTERGYVPLEEMTSQEKEEAAVSVLLRLGSVSDE